MKTIKIGHAPANTLEAGDVFEYPMASNHWFRVHDERETRDGGDGRLRIPIEGGAHDVITINKFEPVRVQIPNKVGE